MSHLPLDARAILEYLNDLGYRNISAYQLKEFMKDLRKLIKYEERMGVNDIMEDYYESLFKRTTASYRAKIDKENIVKNCRSTQTFDYKPTSGPVLQEKRTNVRDELNAASKGVKDGEVRIPIRHERQRDFVPQWQPPVESRKVVNPQLQRNDEATNKRNVQTKVATTRSPSPCGRQNLRPSRSEISSKGSRNSQSRNRKPRSNDPVALYHYYEREWRRFRQQIPGDNSQSKIRSEIRHKLKEMH